MPRRSDVPLASPPSEFWRYFPVDEFVSRVNQAWVDPIRPTSWWRSWWENIRVGGSTQPLSQHLAGLAVDVVGDAAWLEYFASRARAQGLIVVPYRRSHVHVQLWPAGELDRWV